jgi:hypothetical protein
MLEREHAARPTFGVDVLDGAGEQNGELKRGFSEAIFVEGVNPVQNGHDREELARSRALLICEDHESIRFLQP